MQRVISKVQEALFFLHQIISRLKENHRAKERSHKIKTSNKIFQQTNILTCKISFKYKKTMKKHEYQEN